MEKTGSMKRTVFPLALVNVVTWIPLIFAMLFASSIGPAVMITLCAFNLVPGRLMVPARDSWISSLVPADVLGRHIGWRTTITTATYLILFFSMGHVLDIFSSQVETGFVIVFSLALIATLLSTSTYEKIQDQPKVFSVPPVRYKFREFLREVREGESSKVIRYVVLLQAAVHICSPLFVVYMINELNFSYLMFAAVIGSELLGKILSSLLWGRYSDNIGDIPIVILVSFLMPLVPLLWILSSNLIYLILIQLLSGIIWAGFEVGTWSWMHKNTPPDRKPRYLTYVFSLDCFSRSVGAFIGILLLGFNWVFLGSSILGIFLISGLLRFFIALYSLPGLKNMAAEPGELGNGSFEGRDVDKNKAATHSSSHGGEKDKVNPSRVILRDPQEWAEYRKKAQAESFYRRRGDDNLGQRRGQTHNPQEWEEYRKNAVARRRGDDNLGQRRGLLHDPQEWAEYRQRAGVQTPSRKSGKEPANQKQGLLSRQHNFARAPFFNPYSASW